MADGLIPDEGRLILDVAEARANQDRDIVQDQRCDDQIDASRIANEIIVCRDLGKATDGAWNKADWERRYAKRTQGPKPVQVDGSGLQLPGEGSLIAITVTVRNVCAIPPCAPEPAILIDVGALPEAPPGSDADRVARGLPPLNEDRAETLDAIKRLQAELGLPAPSLVASE
ncbi:MAG: hypothetical protein AAGK01_12745 [Pseudomonadota bacterium]